MLLKEDNLVCYHPGFTYFPISEYASVLFLLYYTISKKYKINVF